MPKEIYGPADDPRFVASVAAAEARGFDLFASFKKPKQQPGTVAPDAAPAVQNPAAPVKSEQPNAQND